MLSFQNDITACLQVLEKGGLILYPTDTIWGIGCDATDAVAVARIYQLKNRADHKAMIALVADETDILKYVTQPNLQVFDYIQSVRKPTTVIYEGAVGLADNLISEDGTIGIRICADPFCKYLIKMFKKPIVSTSANISGYPPPGSFADIDLIIKNGVDYIVQHRQDETESHQPSSVIRFTNQGNLVVIRP